MLKVNQLTICGSDKDRYIDEKPYFGFSLSSDKEDNELAKATLSIGNWKIDTKEQIAIPCSLDLKPFSQYEVKLEVVDKYDQTAEIKKSFKTGRLNTPWIGQWISDGNYIFKEKGSPKVMAFRKVIKVDKDLKAANISITALGIYALYINGVKVGKDYFTPGFTTYKNQLQYQIYDIKDLLKEENEIIVYVAGGWAVGDFTYGHKNRISADRQALKAEIRLCAEKEIIIPTDESWEVTTDTPYGYADFYDGEIFDATKELVNFHQAVIEKPKTNPKALLATYGEFVRLHEEIKPLSYVEAKNDDYIYDFGQNFSGIVSIKIKNAKEGQKIVIHHAEVLYKGELCLRLLRQAKCTLEYICKEGNQEYIPTFTYMGFRYVGVSGIKPQDIEITGHAIYSDVKHISSFTCSDQRINRLQENILWSSKSNFVEIPTDCPQRDERMGWTGDIALFSPTACFNFDMQIFLRKWLKDMRAEQISGGGFPNTIPSQSHGFPLTMPNMAIDFWGDASILVPWALYLATGDKNILSENYEMMKKYNKACQFWAHLLSLGKHRYIWNNIGMFHFGDWVAPDTEKMSEWQGRHKWTATASIANTSSILAKTAHILGKVDDEKKYIEVFNKTSDAYESLLTDGKGLIKGKEFQTAYVLPLAFNMFKKETTPLAVNNLVRLIENNNYGVGTGFPGTPFILFSLADNGREDVAFKMLFNDKCPSWLYEVKVGGTTTWERWDALKADGTLNFAEEDGTGGMVSFNHYALGAVGEFLYRRVLGLEPIEGGYKLFKVKPIIPSELEFAKGSTITPYGEIKVEWKKSSDKIDLSVEVPFGTRCQLVLPNGENKELTSGKHSVCCNI